MSGRMKRKKKDKKRKQIQKIFTKMGSVSCGCLSHNQCLGCLKARRNLSIQNKLSDVHYLDMSHCHRDLGMWGEKGDPKIHALREEAVSQGQVERQDR